MVKKNKMEKHWERRYGEEEIETFESHLEENQESYHWKLQSMQENIILLIINHYFDLHQLALFIGFSKKSKAY